MDEDIDGDGRILQMRLKDPNGAWKAHPDDPRLMILREADDLPGGDYYRLLSEGKIRNYDGVLIEIAPDLQGLDLNRQFPVNWQQDESGAGPYPGSEPETRALLQFVIDHPNITGATTYHTYSGVHLRPLTRASDDEMNTQDLFTYKSLGQKAEDLTGYPAVSVFHDFKYDPKKFIKGTFDDWLYENWGIYAWTTEIWSLQRQAGLKDYKYIDWFRTHPPEDDLKILQWADEHIGEDAYVEWYRFDHPQLGEVELGGWHFFLTWRNSPYQHLEKEIAPLSDFTLYHCLASPKLEVYQLDVNSIGDVHSIRLVLQNTGWLPTQVSEQATKMKVVRELEVDIELPDGARLLTGKKKSMVGQLKGRDHIWIAPFGGGGGTDERVKLEWVVQAPAGSEVKIAAVHQRAGAVRQTVTLGSDD